MSSFVDPEIQFMTDRTIEFLTMLGTWFAAGGTIAATLLAVLLARRANKVKLEVCAGITLMVGSDTSEEGVHIAVTNHSERPVTISGVGWRCGRWKRNRRYVVDQKALNQGPVKLEHGEATQFFTPLSFFGRPILLSNLATQLQIANKKDIKTLRAQVHTSVGYTKNVVPAKNFLKELEEAAKSKDCRYQLPISAYM